MASSVLIGIDIDDRQLQTLMQYRAKQMAYAVVNAEKRSLGRIQQAWEENLRSKFIVRRPRFWFGSGSRAGKSRYWLSRGGRAAKIDVFPSVNQARPYGEIFVDAHGSKGGQILLPLFETGGTRRPSTPGAKHIAVPFLGSPARPNIAREVPPAFTIKGLKLKAYIGKKRLKRRRRRGPQDISLFTQDGRYVLPEKGGAVSWRGEQRSFVIPEVGIYRRVGPEPRDIAPLYPFIDPFELDHPKLEDVRIAVDTANVWFKEDMEDEVIDVITHPRRAA